MRKLLLGAALLGLSVGYSFAKTLKNETSPSAVQLMASAKGEALGKLKSGEKAKLVKEAVKIVAETQKVIALLQQGKKEEALKLLERIDNQMAELVQKYNLYRVPVAVNFIEFDGVNNLQLAERLNKAVKEVVAKNDFVTARQYLQLLRNEIDIETTYMPLSLYKEAIDVALDMLKKGKVQSALYALEGALGTLELETVIVPKPLLEAQMLVVDAEKIYKKDPEGALKLLKRAEYDIKLTVALGYLPSENEAKPLLEKIDALMKAIGQNRATEKGFKSVKEELKKLKGAATSTQ